MQNLLIEMFYNLDNYCIYFEEYCKSYFLSNDNNESEFKFTSSKTLFLSEIMTITIYFIDSTTLDVCHNRRIYLHKVFKGIAQRGKSSTGWFYEFKLHLVINDKEDILSFYLTTGNVDDRNEKVLEHLTKELFGKLFSDRGYISQKIHDILYPKGIHLITNVKKNMKNKLMLLTDKILLNTQDYQQNSRPLLRSNFP